MFRKAVWIEHSRGVKRFGLSRQEVEQVFARHPRDNFDRVMADFFKRTLTQEPRAVLDGIFFSPTVLQGGGVWIAASVAARKKDAAEKF